MPDPNDSTHSVDPEGSAKKPKTRGQKARQAKDTCTIDNPSHSSQATSQPQGLPANPNTQSLSPKSSLSPAVNSMLPALSAASLSSGDLSLSVGSAVSDLKAQHSDQGKKGSGEEELPQQSQTSDGAAQKESASSSSSNPSQRSSPSASHDQITSAPSVFDERAELVAAEKEVLAWSEGKLKAYVLAALRGDYVSSISFTCSEVHAEWCFNFQLSSHGLRKRAKSESRTQVNFKWSESFSCHTWFS